jgi:hypothetical protein
LCAARRSPCAAAEACEARDASTTLTRCPADQLALAGTVCRESTAPCDVRELCDGRSPLCPIDAVQAAGVECRAASGLCDVAERCTGVERQCPSDAFVAANSTCRAAANECDVAERCTGLSPDCPFDAVAPRTRMCGASTGPCAIGAFCDGAGAMHRIERQLPAGRAATGWVGVSRERRRVRRRGALHGRR